ncbi:hypothetical protein FIU89_15260 [Roseovarius sp. THAF27]|uniref:hypothetical protein n=1 Tax=Roseovarius sp. THAF27 TaxID=2587850 RepID=UPI0012688C71|nr:hypothetical protein [Roseovarius sp. THAF27]QFT81982.1 hypothetical protein FIU89_15260 [Roseovarius sp. THAF27]
MSESIVPRNDFGILAKFISYPPWIAKDISLKATFRPEQLYPVSAIPWLIAREPWPRRELVECRVVTPGQSIFYPDATISYDPMVDAQGDFIENASRESLNRVIVE